MGARGGLRAVAQHRNHLAEHEERAVDVGRLFRHLAVRLGRLETLATREVDERHLAELAHRHAVPTRVRLHAHRHDGVGAARILVELVRTNTTVPRADAHHRQRVFQAFALYSPKTGHVKSPLRLPSLLELSLVIATEQVVDGLIVDFEVGAPDNVRHARRRAGDGSKDVGEGTGHDSVFAAAAHPILALDDLLASAHAEGLTRAGLTVREDGGGVAVEGRVQQAHDAALDHHVGLGGVRGEAGVEVEGAVADIDGALVVGDDDGLAVTPGELRLVQGTDADHHLDRGPASASTSAFGAADRPARAVHAVSGRGGGGAGTGARRRATHRAHADGIGVFFLRSPCAPRDARFRSRARRRRPGGRPGEGACPTHPPDGVRPRGWAAGRGAHAGHALDESKTSPDMKTSPGRPIKTRRWM